MSKSLVFSLTNRVSRGEKFKKFWSQCGNVLCVAFLVTHCTVLCPASFSKLSAHCITILTHTFARLFSSPRQAMCLILLPRFLSSRLTFVFRGLIFRHFNGTFLYKSEDVEEITKTRKENHHFPFILRTIYAH